MNSASSSLSYDNIFKVYEDEDTKLSFYNLYNTVLINDIAPQYYDKHEFAIGDYWTKLANEYYGDIRLWWIICISNNINNPLDLPEPGTKLKILKPEIVSEVITQIKNNNVS